VKKFLDTLWFPYNYISGTNIVISIKLVSLLILLALWKKQAEEIFQKSYKKFFDVWKILLLFYILSKEISLQLSLTIFSEKVARKMEKYPRLFHKRAEAERAQTRAKTIKVLRSIVVPYAKEQWRTRGIIWRQKTNDWWSLG